MAFLQEPERQPFLRVPGATVGLIAVLVAAHVARVSAPVLWSNNIVLNYAFFPARYSPAFLAAHGNHSQTLWELAAPFVSYIFLHGSYAHLAVNCVWLLPFGAIVTRRFGALLFFALFLVCGIAGAIAHLATNWGSMDYALGASAAVSGLMAAGFRMIAAVPDDQMVRAAESEGTPDAPPLAPLFAPRLLWWSLLWIAINVVAGLTGLGAPAGTGPQLIAWQAHIGGYLAGLLLAGPFDALAQRLRP